MDVADEATLAALAAHAAAADCVATVMRRRGTGADVLVRRRSGVQAELRVAVIGCVRRHVRARGAACGRHRRALAAPAPRLTLGLRSNVDAGKSTLISVLCGSSLDDGRGAARKKIFRHAHEQETGRTSSISQMSACFSADGRMLNDANSHHRLPDLIDDASKVVCFVDLAGHERYLRTTCFGLTGHLPEYAMVLVGANAGLVGMCKEHLGIVLALRVPAFFVVSKIDFAPEDITKATVLELCTVLKKPGVRKRPFIVRTEADVYSAAANMASDSIAPIFLVSSVDGRGLDHLRLFLNLLPQRHAWGEKEDEPAEFVIDEVFSVPGVGTVVAGTLLAGVLTETTPRLLVGPDPGDSGFKPVALKSIHYKRVPATRVVAGQAAALALKKIKRSAVRKGMVLVSAALQPQARWEMCAEIAVLTHSSTIACRYQAVVHVGVVRQTATIVAMSVEVLRSGDRARVRFRFMQRPEYVRAGDRFIFREGRTKGIGVVLPYDANDPAPPAPTTAATAPPASAPEATTSPQ